MAFLDSFWKKVEHYADTGAQNVVACVNESLADINERLRRIEIKQKETTVQLEEIDDFLQNGGSEDALIEALVALTDTIGDFYFFAAADEDSPLFEQARMMWSKAKTAAENAGLEIIEPYDEPFDFRLHSAESTERNTDMANGYVIKTLKCGYMYKDKIVRRAAVVVNKAEKSNSENDDEEIGNETPNIIYL
jgi:molecular chaperone GrpE (heat shock protein)